MRYKYYAVVQDSNGNVVSGASVSVYLAGTATPANVYTSPSGGGGSNNPPQVTSSGDGVIEFWLEHSEYSYGQLFKLVIRSDTLTKIMDNVQIINWATTPYTVDATGAVTGQLVQFDTTNKTLSAVPVYYNSSSSNIGIGTTTPQATLHVNSSGNTGVRIDAPSSQQVGYQLAKDGSVKWSMYIDANSSDLRFWDGTTARVVFASGGNVGIGTTTPAGKLEVAGSFYTAVGTIKVYPQDSTVEGGEIDLLGAGSYGTAIVDNNYGRLRLFTSSSIGTFVGVVVDPSGNVGIGGDFVPAYKLHVLGNIAIQAGTNAFIGTVDNYRLSLRTNNTDRVVIDTNGNVGIGTTSPQVVLHVNSSGNTLICADAPSSYQVGYGWFKDGSKKWSVYIDANSSDLRFFDGTGNRVTFANGGNVGIGTTSPAYRLDVAGDIRSISSGYVYIRPASSDSDASCIKLVNTASATANPYICFGYGSYTGLCNMYFNISDKSLRFNISKTSDGQNLRDAIIIPPANGTQTACIIPGSNGGYTGDWPSGWSGALTTYDISCSGIYYNILTQRSDANLKTDVQLLSDYLNTDCLDVISCLKPIKYVYVDDPLKANRFGFIAQDVSEVCPELVTIDTEGKASLNYMDLIALLTRGIQELYSMLEKVIQKIGGIS